MQNEQIRLLSKQLIDLKSTIASNTKYLREQERLIQATVELGSNHISQLTREADELTIFINQARLELLSLSTMVDNKRFELILLSN
jgi:hypothetical protein